MILPKLKRILVGMIILSLLASQMQVDVAYGEMTKTKYGLVAVLVSESVASNSQILDKVVRYSEDAQSVLPHSKFLIFTVPEGEHPAMIQSALERLYYEGDGTQNEYNRLMGTVIVGDVALPVVKKGDEIFPSIYPYVDFEKKAYIYDASVDFFVENPLRVEPQPEIWHGIIVPPATGEDGETMLMNFFDKNHEFYTKSGTSHIFDRKIFFADFYHEKAWIQNEALASYDERIDGLEREAYGRFTGAYAKKLQDDREGRIREEGAGIVYDVLNGDAPPADPDLAAEYDSAAAASDQPTSEIPAEDVVVPDIHSIHVIRTLWKEFYDAAQKFVSEVNTYVENSGRWDTGSLDTPVSLISKKDKASQQLIYRFSTVLEDAVDDIVPELQSNITLIDDYSDIFDKKESYVNGIRVRALGSAQDCSLYLGTFDAVSESQLVEANRTYNPTATVPSSETDRERYAGCYFTGTCKPNEARLSIRDLAGTQIVDQAKYPDYRECYDKVSIKSLPSNTDKATFVRMSSVVTHKEPTGDTLMAQLPNLSANPPTGGFSKYLPIDGKRYVTFQGDDLSPRRIDYPTNDIWAIDSVEHSGIIDRVKEILTGKARELNTSTLNGNIGSFKAYLKQRMPPAFDNEAAFASWKEKTLAVLKGMYTDIDSSNADALFTAYMKRRGNLTDSQKASLTAPFDELYGDKAAPIDDITKCLDGTCGGGRFQKTKHSNFKTLHDFLANNGDTVSSEHVVVTISVAAGILIYKSPEQKFVFETSGFIPENFFAELLMAEQYDLLADAIAWKNLSKHEKHRYVLERYLGTITPYFFDSANGYEAFYLVADGGEEGIDVGINPGYSVDDDSEFAEKQSESDSQSSALAPPKRPVSLPTRADIRCSNGATDGVDLWAWVPYVICWAEDTMTPPYVIYPEEEGEEGAASTAYPESLKLETENVSFLANPASSTLLTARYVDSDGVALDSFVRGSITFEIVSGEEFGTFVPSDTVTVSSGQGALRIFGTETPGDIRVRAVGKYFDDENEELSVTSNTVSLKTVLGELKMTVYAYGEDGPYVEDSIAVGGNEGFVEVRSADTTTTANVSLQVSDETLFSQIETDPKPLQDGKARFAFVTAKAAGSAEINAAASDGSAVSKSPTTVDVIPGTPTKLAVFQESVVAKDSETRIFLELQDAFGNLAYLSSPSAIVTTDGRGQLVGSPDPSTMRVGLISGKGDFSYRTPSVSERTESILSVKIIEDDFEITQDITVIVLPSIVIALSADSTSAKVGSDSAVNIRFSIQDHNGDPLNTLSSDVVFTVGGVSSGSFRDSVITFKNGSGSAAFIPGLRAGDIRITASHPGWISGEHTISVLPGDPKKIALEPSGKYIDAFSTDPFVIRARVVDIGGNTVVSDNATNITLSASELTNEVIDFDTQMQAQDGVAEFPVNKVNDTGEVHLVAEATGLISGTLVIPVKAILSHEILKGISLQGLYGTFLGAPIGDITVDDYLGGHFLFNGKLQALTAVTRSFEEPERIFAVGPNGYFHFNPDSGAKISFETNGADVIHAFDSEGNSLATLSPSYSSGVAMYRFEDAAYPDLYETGVTVVSHSFPGFSFEETDAAVSLRDAFGKELIRIGNNFDIEIFDTIFTLEPSTQLDRDLFAFDIKNGPTIMATVVFVFPDIEVRIASGSQTNVSGDIILVTLDNQFLTSRKIFVGASTSGGFGYEVLNTKSIVEKDYGWRVDGVQDVYTKPGIGWRGDYKNMLLFASGNTVGASATHYLSDIECLLGDPVISLKLAMQEAGGDVSNTPSFPDSLNQIGFDFSIGEMLYRETDGNIGELVRFDFNNDGIDDIAVVLEDGTVKLLKGISDRSPFDSLGTLFAFSDRPISVYADDFEKDGYDDLMALLPDGTISLQANRGGKFYNTKVTVDIERPTSLVVADFNKDRYPDIVVSDSSGNIFVVYNTSGLFLTKKLIGELGLSVDADAELNNSLLFYYPGMPEPQFDSFACYENSTNPSCSEKNYLESTYIPDYVRTHYATLSAEELFNESTARNADALALATETAALYEQFSNFAAEQGENTELPLPSFTYFLRGGADTNLSIEKHVALPSGSSGKVASGQKLSVVISLRNDTASTISDMAFGDLVPSVFQLKPDSISCEGCKDSSGKAALPKLNEGSFTYVYDSLRLSPGGAATIRYDVFVTALPRFAFATGYFDSEAGVRTTEDSYLDIRMKPEGSPGATFVYFISKQGTDFEMKTVTVGGIPQPDVLNDLSSQANDTTEETQDRAQEYVNSMNSDSDGDGIPDLFDIFSDSSATTTSFHFSLIPKAFAQDYGPFDEDAGQVESETLSSTSDATDASLSNAADSVEGSASAVESAIKGFTCGGGCLALPINIAPLTPGMWNILGIPGGFFSGFAIFSLMTATPFITFGSNPASFFRFYLDPTLNLGLGMALCLGPYLQGQCFVMAIPVGMVSGALLEAMGTSCEELSGNMATLGGAFQNLEYDAMNESDFGVVSVDASAGSSRQVNNESMGLEYGVEGFSLPPESSGKTSSNVRVPSFPAFFDKWFDKQWEEIVNSFFDFSDIIFYYPDVEELYGGKTDGQRRALMKKFEEIDSWGDVVDAIKLVPLLDVKVEKIIIKLPIIIDSNILDEIEADAKSWWTDFLGEVIDFLDSFKGATCGAMDLNHWTGLREYLIEKKEPATTGAGKAPSEEEQYLQSYNNAGDLGGKMSAFNQLLKYRLNDFMRRFLAAVGGGSSQAQYQNATTDTMKQELDTKAKDAKNFAGKDVGKCMAGMVGIHVLGQITELVSSLETNYRILQEYRKLPRKLVQYYDILGIYLSDITNFVDKLFAQFVDWINKNVDRIGLWAQTAYTFEEYIKLWHALIGLFEDYKSSCSLCKSDRFTLKDFILRLFVALPEIPVIPFPNWPDIILDISQIQMGIPITLPVFDIVYDGKLNWPGLPRITLPKLNELKLSLSADLSFQFSLPGIPLLPEPPELPDIKKLFSLPELPELRLPVLPLPPKLPELFSWMESLIKIVKVFMKIVCLINQSLIPFEEMKLKSQVENLTARPLDPLLPMDLSMAVDAKPANIFQSFPEFFKMSTRLDIEPVLFSATGSLVQFIRDIANTWNNFFTDLFAEANRKTSEMSSSLGEAINAYTETAQEAIDAVDMEFEADVDVDLGEYTDDVSSFKLPDAQTAELTAFASSQVADVKRVLAQYRQHVQSLRDSAHVMTSISQSTSVQNVLSLASSVTTRDISDVPDLSKPEEVRDERVLAKTVPLVNKQLASRIIAQTGSGSSSTSHVPASASGTGSVSLSGLYIVSNGKIFGLTKYDDESSEQGDVMIFDVDSDGDNDVVYAYGQDIYLKRAEGASPKSAYYPQVVSPKSIRDIYPNLPAPDMFTPVSDRSKSSSVSWLKSMRSYTLPYVVSVKDRIDESRPGDERLSYFVFTSAEQSGEQYFDSYPIFEKTGDVIITSLRADSSRIYPQDIIVTRNGTVSFDVSDDTRVTVRENSQFTVSDFASGEIRLQAGVVEVVSASERILNSGLSVDSGNGTVRINAGNFPFEISSDTTYVIPAIQSSEVLVSQTDMKSDVLTYSRRVCMTNESCRVTAGEYVHALFDAVISNEGAEYPLKKGFFSLTEKDAELSVISGIVEVITPGTRTHIAPYVGMRVFANDIFSVSSSLSLAYSEYEYAFDSGMLYVLDARGDTTNVSSLPLENGYHYAHLLQAKGSEAPGTVSMQEHLSPKDEILEPIFENNFAEEPIAIFAKKTLSADSYADRLDGTSVYWDLDPYSDADGDGDPTNDNNAEGVEYTFGPYTNIGVHDVVLNVAGPENAFVQKPISIRVFVPQIQISETDFTSGDQIRGRVEPAVPDYPVSVVRVRPTRTEFLSLDAAEEFVGPDENLKYYTNAAGEFALDIFDLTRGYHILDSDYAEIVRILSDNGRVIIHPDFANEYELKVHPSSGELPMRIVVYSKSGVAVASVYYSPEQDSDVVIDAPLMEYSKENVLPLHGVHVKPMNSSYVFEEIPGDAEFYPGGVVLKDLSGQASAYVSSRGDVNFAKDTLQLRVQFTFDDTDPVVFELLDGNTLLAEIFIAGEYTELKDISFGADLRGQYFDLNKNNILDSWERFYGLTGSPEEVASADPDMDLLTNLEEYRAGTNPFLADTDRDGVQDNIEVRGENDPLNEFAAEHQFNDVPKGSPYYSAIQRLYKEGVIQGFEDNTYRPGQNISRAELLKIILGTTSCESCSSPSADTKALYDPVSTNPDLLEFNSLSAASSKSLAFDLSRVPLNSIIHYPDVMVSDWFFYCVEIATKMGVVHGYKGADDLGRNATGLFLPLTNISRAEAVKVFLEAANFTVLSSRVTYDATDEDGNDISEGWYYGPELNYIFTAVELGLLEPDLAGRVYPERKITRGEMAEMAVKVLNKLIGQFAGDDFDKDGIANSGDACVCLPEDVDAYNDTDGCPERALQTLGYQVVEMPKQSGIYVTRDPALCLLVEPIADAIEGDIFYAVISDFFNQKVWRKSNELRRGPE